jgi:ferredoxin
MAGKLKVTVDLDVCVGNAMCPHIAAKTFQLNDDRQSEVTDPNGEPREVVLEAAEACPVSAITVIDSETGEQLFP